MKSKNLILTLFWSLVFVCTFQYGMMISTNYIKKDALEKAELYASQFPDSSKAEVKENYLQAYLDSISDEVVFSIPYLSDYTYQSLKNRQLKFGLDLKGGMQITLGFDMEKFLKSLAHNVEDQLFLNALSFANENNDPFEMNYINSFFEEYRITESRERVIQNFQYHAQVQNQINVDASIDELQTLILQLSDNMIKQTQHLLEQRVNGLGLAQTQINLDLIHKQINIEFPGVKNPERIRNNLLSMASLEFWNVYRITDYGMMEAFINADELLQRLD